MGFTKRDIFRAILLLMITFSGFWYLLPVPLFDDPFSTVVYDRGGELLGARAAKDGQWRFPESDSIPYKFRECIINFEDRYFHYHPGVNPFSLGRALVQNISEGEIVSGGSTLSMQVIRLSRKSRPRTVIEKFIEIILAIRLEATASKEKILNYYASHAPFGGNVVGLETAAWRYFSTDPFNLSWAETACLAVLPNAPSLIHPGRNRDLLLAKRNRLLLSLKERGILSETDLELALIEELPHNPQPLPGKAYHLTERLHREMPGTRIKTTIENEIQEKTRDILSRHKTSLYSQGIRNAACIVTDVSTGYVISYNGNIRNRDYPEYGGDVDIIPSTRSSGSILKPLLYLMMQYRGEILPNSLVSDIPTRYGSYSPKNYSRKYDGVVKASEALYRSLNVPAVRMLYQYGNERFLQDLRKMGIRGLDRTGDHYGLSLILGGGECSLEDLSSVYSSLARVLNNYNRFDGKYFREDWRRVRFVPGKMQNNNSVAPGEEQGLTGAGAIWTTLEALREVKRPVELQGWKIFSSSRPVAWKTGTSFGFRDGWAVATTPEYVVAVWAGNANGEGRPGLTGLNTAAPILFDVLNILPETSWFDIPYDDLRWVEVCSESGYKAGKYCTDKDSILVSAAGTKTDVCPYHILIHLDKNERYRVNSSCYPVNKIIHRSWFVLPPAQDWYYRQRNPGYNSLPALAGVCQEDDEIPHIQFIYPVPGTVVYIPYELNGEKGRVVFEAAHREPGRKIFWSIDEKYIGTTSHFHQLSVLPDEGKHLLTLVDDKGNRQQISFEIVDR